jgi:hypothetical protein
MTPITEQDIVEYITMIRLYYPKAYPLSTDAEQRKKEISALLRSFALMLSEYPKEVCDVAVVNAIKNFNYGDYPKPADIIREIEKMRSAYEKTDGELWAELTGVLREVESCVYRFRFNAIDYNGQTQGDNARQRVEDIFNGLSPELKEYCGNQRGLVNIAQIPSNELQYEKGRFMRIIPTVKERARTRQATSDSLAGIIQGLSVHLSIESSGGGKLLKGN